MAAGGRLAHSDGYQEKHQAHVFESHPYKLRVPPAQLAQRRANAHRVEDKIWGRVGVSSSTS